MTFYWEHPPIINGRSNRTIIIKCENQQRFCQIEKWDGKLKDTDYRGRSQYSWIESWEKPKQDTFQTFSRNNRVSYVPEQILKLRCIFPVLSANKKALNSTTADSSEWACHCRLFRKGRYPFPWLCWFVGQYSIVTAAPCVSEENR